MEKTLKEHLIDTFDDLGEVNLKKFKKRLCDREKEPRVRRAQIESLTDTWDLADLLVDTFTSRDAPAVTIEILEAIGCNEQAVTLREATGQSQHISLKLLSGTTVTHQFKTSIRDNCEFVTEYNLSSDERVPLATRYVAPVIIQRNEEYAEIPSDQLSIDQLFSPGSDGKTPKTVILSGDSGSGKSFMLQKFMLDWASGNILLIKFDVVFLLKCEELMCISEEMGLIELLTRSSSLTSHQITQILQSSPERVLFLIDGYNDLKRATCMDMLKSLLNGDILPESYLLVTTRSVVAEDLYMLKEPRRFIEIMGFSERGVEEYFKKFFGDEQHLRKAHECVKANETLQIACSVPLVCWMVCFCLKYLSDSENEMRKLKTNTSIYVHFVSKLLEHQCKSQSVFSLLKCLGQLAERGTQNQQVLFEEKSLTEAGLVTDTSLFLKKDCNKRKDKEEQMFKFIHINFQEFFTALHYVLLDDKSCSKFVSTWFASVKMKSKTSSPSQNVRASRSSHMPFIWFLCGLSNEKVSSALFTKHSWTVPQTIRKKLKVMIARPKSKDNLALHCLYELHDEEFVREVLKGYRSMNLSSTSLRRTDYWVLLYCLQCCPHITQLNLTHCDLTADKLKILQPALCTRESLRVQMNKHSGGKWSLDLSIRQKDLLLCMSHSGKKASFPSLLKTSFTCPSSEISHFNWTLLLQTFEKEGKYPKGSSEFEEYFNKLLSSFRLVDLRTLHLELVSLTTSWATGIISIIHTHRSLQELSVSVTGWLLDDDVMFLQASLTDPHCTVTIKGWKCNKTTRKCRKDNSLSCNEKVKIYFIPNVQEKLKALNISDPEPVTLNPLADCQCCAHIVDCDEWVQVEPSVCSDEGESKFTISTQPGHYECTRTRMRWVCDCDVTLQYHTVDGRSLIEELERLQCERIGPVFDVMVISGKLKEAHLPHFICLAESDPSLKDAVKVLSQKDEGVVLQSVELTRFHAKIVQPSFSLTTLIINWLMKREEHCNLLVYMLRKDPLILHVYFFPLNDTCSKEKVKESERSSLQIRHPRPNKPFRMNTPHLLEVPDASVHPKEGISFRRDIEPNFFKIKQDRDGDVQLTLTREEDRSTVWEATVSVSDTIDTISRPFQNIQDIDVNNFVKKNMSELIQRVTGVKRIADKLLEQEIIHEEKYSEITHDTLTRQDSMRKICTIVNLGDSSVKLKFISILQEEEPCLFR